MAWRGWIFLPTIIETHADGKLSCCLLVPLSVLQAGLFSTRKSFPVYAHLLIHRATNNQRTVLLQFLSETKFRRAKTMHNSNNRRVTLGAPRGAPVFQGAEALHLLARLQPAMCIGIDVMNRVQRVPNSYDYPRERWARDSLIALSWPAPLWREGL